MVGWHHQLNGHEFGQAPGDGEGQGSLACCSPWGYKELDTIEQLNNNNRPAVYSGKTLCEGSSIIKSCGEVWGIWKSSKYPKMEPRSEAT